MPVHTEQWDSEDVKLYESELEKIFHYMVTFKKFNFSPIDKLNTHGVMDCHPGHMCGGGTSFCSFTPEGDIYPCHNIYFTDPSHSEIIGTVFTGITMPEKLKKYADSNAVTMGCGQCPNTRCYRCIADNFNYNKDINVQVGKPYRCAMSAVERKLQKKCRDAQLVIDLMVNYERLINLLNILLGDYDKEMIEKRKDYSEGWFSNSNTSLDFIRTIKDNANSILKELRKPFDEAETLWNKMVEENPYVDPHFEPNVEDRSKREINHLSESTTETKNEEINIIKEDTHECNGTCEECNKKCHEDDLKVNNDSSVNMVNMNDILDKIDTLENVVRKLSEIVIMNHDSSMLTNK